MAVKLRLMRMGKKKQPTYRVVAADARSPRNGRFIEIIGTYEPRQDPSVIKIDNERAVHWLRHGAQATERVEKLLKISGAWTDFTGEAIDSSVPEKASKSSAKQLAKEEAAAAAADAPVEAAEPAPAPVKAAEPAPADAPVEATEPTPAADSTEADGSSDDAEPAAETEGAKSAEDES